MNTNTYIHVYIYIHIYIYTYTHTYIYIYIPSRPHPISDQTLVERQEGLRQAVLYPPTERNTRSREGHNSCRLFMVCGTVRDILTYGRLVADAARQTADAELRATPAGCAVNVPGSSQDLSRGLDAAHDQSPADAVRNNRCIFISATTGHQDHMIPGSQAPRTPGLSDVRIP